MNARIQEFRTCFKMGQMIPYKNSDLLREIYPTTLGILTPSNFNDAILHNSCLNASIYKNLVFLKKKILT